MRPRLRVLLGGGGVGKTTLASSLAMALARQGRRVALLGIDPARRLRSALGISELNDLPCEVPGFHGQLRAAVLRPEQTLRRWAIESRIGHDDGHDDAGHLLGNPFFELLADGLAASTDALAAGRLVEWAEREPDLDELIVDTAPGLPALEFLAKPDKIIALLEGRLLGWLGGRAGPAGLLGSLAQKLHVPRFAGGLVRLAGLGAFTEVGEMVTQLEACFATFRRRVGVARDWFQEPSTQLLLVGGGGRTADCLELAGALGRQGLRARAVLLNRTLAAPLLAAARGDGLPDASAPDERAFLAWLRALAAAQTQAVSQLQTLGLPIALAPRAASASGTPGLLQIGAALLAQLEGGP